MTISLLHNSQIVQEIWNSSPQEICIYLFIEATLLLHYRSIFLDSFSVRSYFRKSDLWTKLWLCLYGARSVFKLLNQELHLNLSLCTRHIKVNGNEPENIDQTGARVCSTQNLNLTSRKQSVMSPYSLLQRQPLRRPYVESTSKHCVIL